MASEFDPNTAKPIEEKKKDGIFDPSTATPSKSQNKWIGGDVVTAIKQGVEGIPGAITGLADIPAAAFGFNRPFSRAADAVGDATGFKPGKWAKQADSEYSPATQQAKQAIDQAWEDPNTNATDVAKAYIENPRATVLNAVESVPSMVVGGLAGRVVGGAAKIASTATRGAIGEGAISAGQTMEQIDPNVDAQKAAGLAAASGAVVGAIGGLSGKVANKLGIGDPENLIAGGVNKGAPAVGMPIQKRIPAGMVREGLLEEAPQSAVEQAAQNIAENKPITEGMARNVVEGSLAGGLMGGGGAVVDTSHPTENSPPPSNDAPTGFKPGSGPAPSITGTDPASLMRSQIGGMGGAGDGFMDAIRERKPSEAIGIDPGAGPMSAAAALAVDTGASPATSVTGQDGASLMQRASEGNKPLQEAMLANDAERTRQAEAAIPFDNASEADRRAYEDAFNRPAPTEFLALSADERKSILYGNKEVNDGGKQFAGTQDGDILNGMGTPFKTRFAAARRARMMGEEWGIAPVDDGFVARWKGPTNETSQGIQGVDRPSSAATGNQPAPAQDVGKVDSQRADQSGSGQPGGLGQPVQPAVGTGTGGVPGAVVGGDDTVSRISQAKAIVGEQELMRRAKALANDPRLVNKGAEVGGVPADAVAMEAAARATVSGYWIEPPIDNKPTPTTLPAKGPANVAPDSSATATQGAQNGQGQEEVLNGAAGATDTTAPAAPSQLIAKTGGSGASSPATTRPNVVIRDVRGFDGKKLGDIIEPHDGTIAGIRAAANRTHVRLQNEFHKASNSASRIGATDETGRPAWAVSPNGINVEPVGTLEAESIFGNPDAINKMHGPHSWKLPSFIADQARTQGIDVSDPKTVKALTEQHLDLIERALADRSPVPDSVITSHGSKIDPVRWPLVAEKAAAIKNGAAQAAPLSNEQIAAKQIPDMTDAELVAARDHYGPGHKRTAKITKEINRRALAAKLKQNPTTQENQSGTQTPEAQQAAPQRPQEQPAAAGAVGGQIAERDSMIVTFGGKSYNVSSIKEAQEKWIRFRETSGAGVSEVGNGVRVTDQNGKFIARVSYNGRAWSTEDALNGKGSLIAEAPEVDLSKPMASVTADGTTASAAPEYSGLKPENSATDTAATGSQEAHPTPLANATVQAPLGGKKAAEEALNGKSIAIDYKGFTRGNKDGGAFSLTDGNMTVSVEPTQAGKFQASFRGAKSSPHLAGVQGAVDWAAAYREEAKRAETKQEQKSAKPEAVDVSWKTRAEVLDSLQAGQKVRREGTTTWIEQTTIGKVQTYVIKSKDDDGVATFTKGPVGPDRSWGWGKLDAAQKAVESWSFADETKAPEQPSKLVQAMNDLADVRQRIADQGQVVDDRLVQRERQLVAIVKELEAAGKNDELDGEMKAYENGQTAQTRAEDKKKIASAPSAKTDALTEKEKAAKAKMLGAAAKLAELLSKNTRANITPEQEQKMLPIVIELFDGAMELGYVKFKQAARYVRDFIAQAIDQDAADSIPIDTLQGAYIATARRHADKEITPKVDVIAVESIAELDEPAESEHTGVPKDGNATQQLDLPSTNPLEGTPSEDVRATGKGRESGAGPDGISRGNVSGNSGSDGAGGNLGGSLGGDPGVVPVPARGNRAGAKNAKKPRVSSPRRADTSPELFGTAGGLTPDAGANPAPNAPAIQAPQPSALDFTITDELSLGEGGQKTKFRNNVAAIRLVRDLESTGRMATPDEQAVLSKYVGWGGLPQAFDPNNADWSREHAELTELMSPEELADARKSTRYAHYTSREIIVDGIYAAMRRFGFTGGKTLEAGAGVGNFIGLMPADMRSAGRFTAIEREPFSSAIARNLYPQQSVQQADFTEFKGTDAYFDAAVGNPPFASDPQTDRSGRKHLSGLSLHNYFFAKAIDMLREGGIMAQVVTNSFMDAKGDRARKYISDRAEFLGAIRLPNNAFSKNSGTEVTTDIIFLKKRPDADVGSKAARADAKRWLDIGNYTDKNGKQVALNQYFIDNPEMMLGDFGAYGTMYGPEKPALVGRPGQDTAALLKAAVERLPASVYKSIAETGSDNQVNAAVVALKNPPVLEGGYFLEGDKLMQRISDIAGEARGVEITPATQWTSKTALGDAVFDRIKRLAAMRSTVRNLLAAEMSDDAESMKSLRETLNQQYDAYVGAHGLLNEPGTLRVFDDDPDFPLLASLEHGYTPGISVVVAKRMGVKPAKATAKKGPIFTQRVVAARQAVQKVDTPADALAVSMAERGKLDAAYIGQLLGKDPSDVLKELSTGDKPLLFLDPATDEYVLRDAYLSGNVRAKLAQARQAGMFMNVTALEAVQPEDVGSHEITARLGSPWVPTDIYRDFAKHLYGDDSRVAVVYLPANSSYQVFVYGGSEVAMTNTWGTREYPGDALLQAVMNNRSIKVTYRDDQGKTYTDVPATEKANEKAQELKNKFGDWLFSDPDRSEVLTKAYNETNNNYVTRIYNGSHMTFPGKVPDSVIKFRRHQRNAIARIVQDRTALLDHVVGAGKTFTVISGAMELKRTGLARKPMVVVPNHLVKQWAADFYRLYPGANVLTATKKDFERPNRRKFLAKIATGDWDAVVIAHSSFGFIKPSPEFEAEFNGREIQKIMATIQSVEDSDGEKQVKKRTIKQLEGIKERLENRIRQLRDKPMDDLLDFEQIGVDQIFVDEAHLFKNLMYTTKMQGVAGLNDPTGSQRAYDMYVKTNQVMEKNGRGQGVVFATGTPVSNSLAEMYHMMRYLMPNQMRELGFDSFDAWANTYASVEQVWMQAPSGDGFKAQNRMSNFVNTPELLKMFDQVSDTVTMDDIKKAYAEENDGAEFPLPKLRGGRRTPVSLVKSKAQDDYMAEIAKRAQAIEKRKGPPQKGDDNILVVMSDARKAAMDIRLVNPDLTEREKGGRIDASTDAVVERYKKFDSVKGAQLVFSDLGTPIKHAKKELAEYEALQARIQAVNEEVATSAALGNEAAIETLEDAEAAQAELDAMGPDWLSAVKAALRGFSIYDDFKAALIEKGIPEAEIAFIHDYNTDDQKASLFRKVNAGQIRVLLGSTAKLGAGTNVQERLVALHHLDVPWRPSDVEQREGRIERQGNRLMTEWPNFEIEILAYVTQDTLDMRMWQVQETKLKMINQLRTRKIGREIDNAFEDMELSAGEMQAAATGDINLLKEIQLRNDVKKLEQRRRAFDGQRNDLISRKRRNAEMLRDLPEKVAAAKEEADQVRSYAADLQKNRPPFRMNIDGKDYTSADEAQAVLRAMDEATEEVTDLAGDVKTRKKPLAVTIDGELVKNRATMAELYSNAAGDKSPIAWTVGEETYRRRTVLANAIRSKVQDAIADEILQQIGSIGGYDVAVEGSSAKDGTAILEVTLSRGGEVKLANSFMPTNTGTAPDRVIVQVESLMDSAISEAGWLASSLERAKKDAADLAKVDAAGEWPEQEKLDAARAAHKAILGELKKKEEMQPAADSGDAAAFSRAMREKISAGLPLFNRQDAASTYSPAARAQAVKAVESTANAIRGAWANAPEVIVAFDMQDPVIPEAVRKADEKQRSGGAKGAPEGFYFKGKVYLMASQIKTPQDAARVLFHEALGHHGLRGAFGKELDGILNQIVTMRRAQVDAKVKEYGLRGVSNLDLLTAAEEVLAEMAQTTPEIGFVKRAIAAIRTWLRKNVPGFKDLALTDAEIIRSYILPARGWVEKGGSNGGGPRGGLAFSLAKATDQTMTAAFKAWFGGSKVVGAGGKPLVVYHGTEGEIRKFEPYWKQLERDARPHELQGNGSIAQLYKLAKQEPEMHFFAAEQSTAESYGPDVIEAYLRVENLVGSPDMDRDQALRLMIEEGADGAIFSDTTSSGRFGGVAYVVRKSNQIKSATGNNGDFDPTNPDIRFSRAATANDLKQKATEFVNDFMNVPGKLSWWHKTVGTQYNLAQRSPQFRRVFTAVQNFINDVSYYATEAANKAPSLLPRLETWRDAIKSPVSGKDAKAISAPIFDGTLNWTRDETGQPIEAEDVQSAGIVWTTQELKDRFDLSDGQIKLYREFRESVDDSLSSLAKSHMLYLAGKDAADLKNAVMEAATVAEASQMLQDRMGEIAASGSSAEAAAASTTGANIIETEKQTQRLIQRGYAPLSRFGHHTLDVLVDGERQYFGLFESAKEAAEKERELRAKYPDADITRGTMSEQSYKLFAGVTPETAELFGEMMGVDDKEAFQEYIKLARSTRSAMRRMIQREGIEGFSEDAGRVLAGFVYSNARQASRNLHIGDMDRAASAIPKEQGELKDHAINLVQYIKNPTDEAQAIRGLLFAQYIGGSVASAMVNMTQPFTMSLPWLSQFGGLARAGKQMAAAVKDVGRHKKLEPSLAAALKRGEEDGTVSPQEVFDLMKQAQGRASLTSGDGTATSDAKAMANNLATRIGFGWGKMFSAAEQFNRRVTFIAAYRTAVEQGMADPDAFARQAIHETQGVYNRGNRPDWARGAVGGTLFTFKQYSIAYLEMLHRMAKRGAPGSKERAEGMRAVAYSIGVLLLMSGVGGAPGADDLDDLLSGLGQAMGYNFDSRSARRKYLTELFGDDLARFVERGVSGLPGAPIDVSGRLGMGNLIPGTGLLTKKQDHTRDVLEIAGPAGDLFARAFAAAGKVVQGDILGAHGAAATIAPRAAANLIQSGDMMATGMYRDRTGKKVVDTDTSDALSKALGFQPNAVKRVQDSTIEVQRMIGLNKLRETQIADKWAQGVFEKDQDKVKEAMGDLKRWNEDNPDLPIRIKFNQIRSRVETMNMDKAKRIAKTAPVEIRRQAREAMAQ